VLLSHGRHLPGTLFRSSENLLLSEAAMASDELKTIARLEKLQRALVNYLIEPTTIQSVKL